MALTVRDGGVWKQVTIQPKIRTGGVWTPVKKMYVVNWEIVGTPPAVPVWHKLWDWTTPSIFPPGKNIRTGVGIGPDPHIDVDWTVNTNNATDEFYYNVRVELWTVGGTLLGTQIVGQNLGTVHFDPSYFGGTRPTVFGRLFYRNTFNANEGPSTDTSSIVVQG